MTSKWIKFLAVILCGCLAFGFSGCDGGTGEESSSDSSVEEEEKIVKVGYILHGSADEDGFSGQINEQRKNAAKHCSGVETYYIDNVSVADFEGAVKALNAAGCKVIVSCSSVFTNALSAIASKYMNIDFINYGAFEMGTANVTPYSETTYQAAYIAGTIAAYNSKTEKIGMVADGDLFGIYPTVNAAALGTQTVFKNAQLFLAGATADDEIEKAIDELAAKGCDVVICYTESTHSAEYCEKKGIKFIGNHDYSAVEDDYRNMIMYYYSKRDSFFLAKFKQLQYDEWQTMPSLGTMANGIVNVSEALKNNAKEDTQKLIDHVAPLVTSGKLYIFKGELKDTNGTIRHMQTEILTVNQIFSMNWYVLGVNVVGNFRQPQETSEPNKFEIKS